MVKGSEKKVWFFCFFLFCDVIRKRRFVLLALLKFNMEKSFIVSIICDTICLIFVLCFRQARNNIAGIYMWFPASSMTEQRVHVPCIAYVSETALLHCVVHIFGWNPCVLHIFPCSPGPITCGTSARLPAHRRFNCLQGPHVLRHSSFRMGSNPPSDLSDLAVRKQGQRPCLLFALLQKAFSEVGNKPPRLMLD